MRKPEDRPLKDKTIEELVHLFDENCIAKKRLGTTGATLGFDGGESDLALPSTFLKDPASDAEIEVLDQKVRAEPYNFSDGLPADYKEFLKITNGIYAFDDGASNDEIFRPVSEVEIEDGWLELELLPWDIATLVKVEWPTMPWGIQLGAGGDEGAHHIADPATIAKAVEALEKACKSASKENKRKVEDAVKKIYGSMSALRKLRCIVIRMYHWAAETEFFTSFKHLLEDFTQGMIEYEDKGSDDDGDGPDGGEDHDDDDDGCSGDKTKSAMNRRKQIPDGETDALKDLKLIFTGTFDMDRNTCKSTVEKYGGKLTTKLEDANYVVLGINPGPKKIETIKSKNLTTIDEEGFFQLLKRDIPRETQTELRNADSKSLPQRKSGNARKEAPEGKRNALNGLKILFTGTMETMDRATAKKTAEKYGAKVITKLEDTDYVVIGISAGPKKIQEIEKKKLKTLSEQEFLSMLQHTKSNDAQDDDVVDEAEEVKIPSGKRAKDQKSPAEKRTSKRSRKN